MANGNAAGGISNWSTQVSTYRYTVVNGQTVLVEPRSRRIVQVVD